MAITYAEASGRIRVLRDGKRIGTIYREHGTVPHGSGGYYYAPVGTGDDVSGPMFRTIEAVKASIEGATDA